ncbi:hypothetical protein SEA_ENNEA_9 [Gordonia phage Ennea]|uniref:Uncharacterized protein n=1 Tax=Gordonia Phage Lollipop1437 TaxID=2588505 RepID=A0A4Y6EKW9_9CAUD|nr:hypothetical protein KNU64_gp08 [Gordonia Phage Lollipop1437]QDF19112.1 hypothetical protein SEA_LOLLIPOP1437_8 [Gordonia Phage Lollipop1437]QRI45245.1 hypothetical protein SEA_ENNEA_9 [Gordonia phage Ennea]
MSDDHRGLAKLAEQMGFFQEPATKGDAPECEAKNWRNGAKCVLPKGHPGWHGNLTTTSWPRHEDFRAENYPDPEAVEALEVLVSEFGNTVGSMSASDWDGMELLGDFLEKYEVRKIKKDNT